MTSKNLRSWAFLLLVFLVPLVINPWGVDLYEIPKNMIFKVGVSVLGIFWIFEAIRTKRIQLFFSKKMGIGLLVFAFILFLSLFVSANPLLSFWGAYYKQGGLVNMLYYLVFFVISADFLSDKKNRILFLRVLSCTGFLVSIYALVQKLGFDFLPSSVGDLFEGRSFSTLGNPTALASFLIFPIGAELALYEKNKPFVSIVSLGFMFFALLASRGRASILGLILVGILFLLKRFKLHKKKLALLFGLGLFLLVSFIAVYGQNTRSLSSRFALWDSSIHMIQAHPIVGYGLENFASIFPSYATADFYKYEDYYALADRPHNEFLEQWINLGILGAAFYLLLVFLVLRKFWQTENNEELFVSAALLALFVANCFGFSLLTHFVFFTLFLAALFTSKPRSFPLSKGGQFVLSGVCLLLALSISFPIRFLVADVLFKTADNAFLNGDANSALSLVHEGQHWDPFFAELYTLSFKIDFGLALQNQDINALKAATQDNQNAYRIDGGSLKTITSLAQVYVLQDRSLDAETVLLDLEKSVNVVPLLDQIIGEFYYQQQRYTEAIPYYEKLLSVLPKDWEAPVLTQRTMSEASRIFWKNHPDFITILQHLVDAYQKTGNAEAGEALLLKLR